MKTKPFDCVEMKGRIQQEMAEEEARRGSDEMKRRRDEWLKTGSDPLARWWRSLAKPAPEEDCASLVLREEPPAE